MTFHAEPKRLLMKYKPITQRAPPLPKVPGKRSTSLRCEFSLTALTAPKCLRCICSTKSVTPRSLVTLINLGIWHFPGVDLHRVPEPEFRLINDQSRYGGSNISPRCCCHRRCYCSPPGRRAKVAVTVSACRFP